MPSSVTDPFTMPNMIARLIASAPLADLPGMQYARSIDLPEASTDAVVQCYLVDPVVSDAMTAAFSPYQPPARERKHGGTKTGPTPLGDLIVSLMLGSSCSHLRNELETALGVVRVYLRMSGQFLFVEIPHGIDATKLTDTLDSIMGRRLLPSINKAVRCQTKPGKVNDAISAVTVAIVRASRDIDA